MSSSPENPLIPINIVKKRRADDGDAIVAVTAEAPLEAPQRKIVSVKRRVKVAAAPAVVLAEPELVPVKGNNKVVRCRRCQTFVKAGATHSKSDCDGRLARKAQKREPGARKRSRKFRMTPKRRKYIEQYVYDGVVAREVFKNMKRLEKWVAKKEGRLSKNTKKMFGKIIESFHKQPKNVSAAFRHCGL